MTLAEKIEMIQQYGNEVAFGYSDSGCCWTMQYGPRGCGSMMDDFGDEITATETETAAFEEAIDYFLSELIKRHGTRTVSAG